MSKNAARFKARARCLCSSGLETQGGPERAAFLQPAEVFPVDKLFTPALPPHAHAVRERLAERGAASLPDVDLLAILIRQGRKGETAENAARRLLAAVGDRLIDLGRLSLADARAISPALTETAWAQISAGVEMGRRVAAAAEAPPEPAITGTASAVTYCRRRFARLATDGRQEEFWILVLDTRHHVRASHRITIGTLDASLVHPREVFQPAIRDSAAAILLVHNHPSGDPTPSPEDHAVTRRLEAAGRTLGIDVLDHIVVASTGCVSLKGTA